MPYIHVYNIILSLPPSPFPLSHSLSLPPSTDTQPYSEVVNKPQIPPLHPQTSADSSDEATTLELMEYLLKSLTQVDVLYWDDPSNYIRGFAYLFFSFKLFFLACLYKDFRSSSGLYLHTKPLPTRILQAGSNRCRLGETESLLVSQRGMSFQSHT